ncbi:MAG: hypothetical protein WD020_03605 [Acidimicrobiia bacterium]
MTGDRTLPLTSLVQVFLMNSRVISAVCVALALTSCTPGESTDAPPTTSADTTSTAVVEPVQLTYTYVPGETLTYDVAVNQDIAFNAAGDADGFGDAELPIDADLVTESSGTTTYTISTGPSPTSATIDISARFPETRVAGTVNGDSVDSLEEGGVEADLARIDAVDVTVVVDALGRLLDDANGDRAALGADLAALTGLTNDLFAVPIGPVLVANRPVVLGDSWESTSNREGPTGQIRSTSASEVLATTSEMFVIETTTVTDAYSVDFSEQFRDLFLGFAELEGEGEVPPEVLEQLDTIEFVISVEESTTVEVADFDVARGLIRSATKTTGMRLSMVFRAPNDDGDITGFDISLDISQAAVFTLAG